MDWHPEYYLLFAEIQNTKW